MYYLCAAFNLYLSIMTLSLNEHWGVVARLFFRLSILFVVQTAAAQASWLFTTETELPTSLVSCVIEDNNHCIWVATEDGLCRFDGSCFVTYRAEAGNPNSLQDNYVRTLALAPTGQLLVGTRAGLQVYRPESNDFSELAVIADRGGEPSGDITSVLVRKNGEMWCSGNRPSCLKLMPDGTPILSTNPFSQTVMLSEGLAEDSKGRIWMARRTDYLFYMDNDSVVHKFDMDTSDKSKPFCVVYGSQNGLLYVAGPQPGLYRYDDGKFVLVGNDPNPKYVISCLYDLDAYRMLLGTDNAGLLLYDLRTQNITPYPIDDGRFSHLDPKSLKVHGICRGSDGSLWLALYQLGVLAIPDTPQPFHVFGPLSRTNNIIGDKCVTSITTSSSSSSVPSYWIATDNGGLYHVDKEGHQLSHYEAGTESNLVPSSLMSVYDDSQHRLWFGSYNQGYGWIDQQGKLHRKSVPHYDIYDYAEDKEGHLWACSMGQGILRFDESAQQFVPVVDGLLNLWCNALTYDRQTDAFYVGTFNGLTVVPANMADTVHLEFLDDVVFAITHFTSDTLALATNHGLVLYNPTTGDTVRYTTQNGLPANLIYGVESDGHGGIWLSGNMGLCCLHPATGVVNHFTMDDGLHGNEFYKNASLRGADGTLWFGGSGGLTWFDPKDISREGDPCQVRITDIMVGGQSLPLSHNVFENEDNAISFQLGTLPLLHSHRALYSYKLDDDSWVTLPPHSSHATVSHLSGGWHTFRFRATINGLSSEVTQYNFRILPPWYLMWWAWLIWVSILGTMVWLIYLQIQRRMLVKQRLQKYVQARAINEAKMDFFINISHEIRTPMTMIINPLQKLILEDADPERQRSYRLILRNSNRIIGLINQLMDVRKIEKNQMQLYFSPIQIGPYIQQIVENFSDVADQRQLQLSFQDQTPVGQTLWVDPHNFDKILVNLLSNSFRHTPMGGTIQVLLLLKDNRLQIEVTDSGEGIPQEARAHIFDRFYQVHTLLNSSGGTGIGLHLTNSLVALHSGTIQVTDPISLPEGAKGPGVRFVLTFPIGNEHLRAEQMVQNAEEKAADAPSSDLLEMIEMPKEEIKEETPAVCVPSSSSSRQLIVIAEDDDEIRNYLVTQFSEQYNVVPCSNGKQALETLLKQEPDLLISDVMMPDLDGLSLCQQVRKNVRINHLPIILLTAKTTDEDRLQGLTCGADAYLTKPFNLKVLKQMADNLMRQRESLRKVYSGKQLPTDQIDTPKTQSPDEKLMERIIRVVNENLSNPDFTVDMVASEVGISRVHLYRKMKQLSNQSAHSFLRNIRLAKAAELMSQKAYPVAEVAHLVGFSTPSLFTIAFKEAYGMTPTSFMNEKHKTEMEG